MIILCGIAVAVYFPWLLVLLKTIKRTSEVFWQTEIPTIWKCICYLFDGRLDYILCFLFLGLCSCFFIKQCGKTKHAKNIMYDFAEKEIVWVMAGLFAIFGTIIMGIFVSHAIRPMFITRYIYPTSTIAWVLLGFFCEKSCSRWRGALVIGIGILLLSYGILHYITLYTSEYNENENLERTLNLTQQEIANDAVVYSDLSHVTWTIGELYYPNAKQVSLDWNNLPKFDREKENYLITENPITEKQEIKLKEGDIKLEQVVSNGLLGTLKVEIYKVNMN